MSRMLHAHIAAAILVLLPAVAAFAGAQSQPGGRWVAGWIASPQPRWDGDFPLPTKLPYHLWDQTIRQVARVGLAGTRVRVVLSNRYGEAPLVLGGAHVAPARDGGSIHVEAGQALRFSGRTGTAIPPVPASSAIPLR